MVRRSLAYLCAIGRRPRPGHILQRGAMGTCNTKIHKKKSLSSWQHLLLNMNLCFTRKTSSRAKRDVRADMVTARTDPRSQCPSNCTCMKVNFTCTCKLCIHDSDLSAFKNTYTYQVSSWYVSTRSPLLIKLRAFSLICLLSLFSSFSGEWFLIWTHLPWP